MFRFWALRIRMCNSIPAFVGTVESEGRQMKQCWIQYEKKIPPKIFKKINFTNTDPSTISQKVQINRDFYCFFYFSIFFTSQWHVVFELKTDISVPTVRSPDPDPYQISTDPKHCFTEHCLYYPNRDLFECCGSWMFIPDPGSWFLPIPDPGSRITKL